MLCLARALLRQTNVVVLDEATSNIDSQTDQLIQQAIKEYSMAKGATILAVTHRIDHCDHEQQQYNRVIVLQSGRIIHCGSPEEALADRN